MGSTEIVVMFPITYPRHSVILISSTDSTTHHNPSPPHSRTSLKEVARHQQQTETHYRRYPHRKAPHLSRRHRWLRSHRCIRRCRRCSELGVEPPVEERVTVGFLGLFFGDLWGSCFLHIFFIFHLPSLTTVMKQSPTTLRPPTKKRCIPTSQVHGFAHEAPPFRFRADQHVVFLLSCGAVTYHVFQYFDTPMQVNTHCKCSRL